MPLQPLFPRSLPSTVTDPTAFYSHEMKPAELNNEIYDKELLVIFETFQQWHNYLEGPTHAMLVLSDHKNLEYFATMKQLTH